MEQEARRCRNENWKQRSEDLGDGSGLHGHELVLWPAQRQTGYDLSSVKIQGRTFHDTWKQNGKAIEDVHGAASETAAKTTVFAPCRLNRIAQCVPSRVVNGESCNVSTPPRGPVKVIPTALS